MHAIRSLCFLALVLTGTVALGGWDPDKKAPDVGDYGDPKVAEAISAFLGEDPGMQRFFDNAHGFAVFPGVGKGGIGIGGAAGKGKVYAQGQMIGNVKLRQITIGFQLGGQKYREIIFFENKDALDKFTAGDFEFSAQASAVAATAGASADADYSDNVAVFTLSIKGLMYEATIGGQKFKFEPLE